MGSRITIKMIADKAGTSIGTVDRALSNRPGINKETKERILQIARELGYSPNPLASALSRKKTIRIAVVYPSAPRYFYGYIEKGVEKARAELADYGVLVDDLFTSSVDPIVQEQLMRSVDWSQYQGIAINVCGNVVSRYIDQCAASGIPVVTFNADAPQSKRLCYIGNDARQSGRLGAELMGKLLGGHGKTIVLGSFTAAPTFIERYGGFCEVIQEEYPDISIFPCAECRGDYRKASTSILQMLKEMPDIRGIFLTGTTGTIGAAQALKSLEEHGLTVIGYDLTPRIIDALRENYCSAVLYQDPVEQGYQAVKLLARHLLEGWLPEQDQMLISTKVLFKYNVDGYPGKEFPDDD